MRNWEVKGNINDLCGVKQESDILTFYNKVFKASEPTIIELIGSTGAGKTTFCQQFVDEEGKKVLGKTISASGNNTIIQTDIVILEDTKNRLFLKARTKRDIIKDLILVALNIDAEFKFDVKKNITDVVNKAGLKNNKDNEISVNINLVQGVYNLFRTNNLLQKFQKIAKDLQLNFKRKYNIERYVNDNTTNKDLIKLLEYIIYSKLKINDFYGGRHEISLDHKNILEKTLIPTNIFNRYKEGLEAFNEIVSFRLLFEQAILVLRCNEKAKLNLPEKFKKGVVFRQVLGHKKTELGIENNLEVNCKILLIPAATGGQLVDDKFVEQLNNMTMTEAQKSIVVITKIDKASSYEEYARNNYAGFIESLKGQIVTTHNSLIGILKDKQKKRIRTGYKIDKNANAINLFKSFDNTYLSKITKDKHGIHDSELHKIICKSNSRGEISENDIEDIVILDNWHSLISSTLEKENKEYYSEGNIILGEGCNKKKLVLKSSKNIKGMVSRCIDNFKWRVICIKHLLYFEQIILLYIINVMFGITEILTNILVPLNIL